MLAPWFDTSGAFSELDMFRRQMDSLFERAIGLDRVRTSGDVHVREEDGRHVLTMDLPGVSADELELNCTRGQLTLQVERKVDGPESARALHRERRSWRFSRTISLPDNIDVDNISAELKDGVLTLALPHRPETRPRRIAVSVS